MVFDAMRLLTRAQAQKTRLTRPVDGRAPARGASADCVASTGRHVSSIQKARIDASIRQSSHAKYSRVGPNASSVQSAKILKSLPYNDFYVLNLMGR